MLRITNTRHFVEALRKAIEIGDTTLLDNLEKFATWEENATRRNPYGNDPEFIKDIWYTIQLSPDFGEPLQFTWREERGGEYNDRSCINGGLLFYDDKWHMHT